MTLASVGRTQQPGRAVVVMALALLVLVGFGLRVRHLGDLGLIVDEGTQALAVRGALEHGRPRLDSGEIYTRNPAYLLAQAVAARSLGLDELSLRLPSALFGAVVVPATYLLGAATLSRGAGLLAASVIAFSAWEIELSRYARFYTAFQLLYVLSLACFYRGFMEGRRRWAWIFLPLAAATVATHELGIALAGCFLIPLLSPAFSARRKLASVAAAALFAGAWSAYQQAIWAQNPPMEFGDPGIAAPAAPAAAPARAVLQLLAALPIHRMQLPTTIPLQATWSARPWLLVVPLGITAWGILRMLRSPRGELSRGRKGLGIAILAAALFQQFGLVAVLGFLDALLFLTLPLPRWLRASRAMLTSVAALLVFWGTVSLTAPDATLKTSVLELFGYPDFLRYFVYWYVVGWPVLTLATLVGLLLLLMRHARDRFSAAPLFLLGALGIPVVAISLFLTYLEARYTFHLYPLLVVVFAEVCLVVGAWLLRGLPRRPVLLRGLAPSLLGLVVLFASQDANPIRAWSIGSRGHDSFRDPVRSVINWSLYADFHQDHKTPSLFVRERLSAGDRVIAAGPPHVVSIYHYYVGRVDAMIGRWRDFYYYRRLGDGRTVGYVTGSTVLRDPEELAGLEHGGTGTATWLLGDRLLFAEANDYYPPFVKDWLSRVSARPDFVGLDGRTFAVRVD